MSVKFFAHFRNLIIFLLILNCRISLCILDSRPLLDMSSANMFSHSVGCLFVSMIGSFETQIFWFLSPICLFFFFGCYAFLSVISKKLLPNPSHKYLYLFFFLKFYSFGSYILTCDPFWAVFFISSYRVIVMFLESALMFTVKSGENRLSR